LTDFRLYVEALQADCKTLVSIQHKFALLYII